MKIELAWDTAVPEGFQEECLVLAAAAALEHGGEAGKPLQLILLSDEALAELHGRFLQDDSPTDVMAFDLGDEEDGPQGEVYVSVDCARRVSDLRGVPLERELVLYVVHGCLHLCGFDDHEDEDREQMRAAENTVMQRLGYEYDAAPHELGS